MTASLSSVCSLTYAAFTPMVSCTLFAPPLDVAPTKPSRKRRHEESLEDRLEILAAFEELWASHKLSSQHPLAGPGPSSASLAASSSAAPVPGPSSASSAASSSAAPVPGPSVHASGVGPLTTSRSLPSSRSAASSWLLTCTRFRFRRPLPGIRAALVRSPSTLAPSCHHSQSRHQSPGRRSTATRSPS